MSRSVSPARVLFPLGLGTALSLIGDATLYTVLPTHAAQAGILLGSVGLMLGANRAVRLLSNSVAGRIYDRYPRRRLFVPALLLGAISTATYVIRGFWPLLIGRLLWGLAWSGIWVGGATMILDVTTDRDRGRWTGLYQTWFFMGAAAGSLAGGLLVDWLGYVSTMWIGAGVTALGAAVALVFLPETRDLRHEDGLVVPRPTVRLHANRGVWAAALLQGMNRFVLAGLFGATMALLTQERLAAFLPLGIATLNGLFSAGRTLLSMGAAPVFGAGSDRLGDRWSLATWAAAAASLSMLLIAWGAPVLILPGVALGALAGGGIQTLVTALIGDLVSAEQRGRAVGVMHTVGDLGSAAGPLIAYAVLPWIGLRGVYLLGAGLFLVQWIVMQWSRARGKQQAATVE